MERFVRPGPGRAATMGAGPGRPATVGAGPGRPATVAALLVAAALTGCLRDPVDVLQTGEGVVLAGLVSAHTDTVFVAIARVADRERPEPGATLRLETPHGDVDLVAAPIEQCGLTGGWACYRGAYTVPPVPGERYRLEGTLANGTSFTGATTIPDPPLLVYGQGPEAGSPVADTLRSPELRSPPMRVAAPDGRTWVAIPGGPAPSDVWTAQGLERCTTTVHAGHYGFSLSRLDEVFGSDFSSFNIGLSEPVCGDEPVAWDSMAVEARVDAFDAAFSAYWEQASGFTDELFPHEAAWGVEGVLGVFGSSSGRRLVLIVANPAAS